jgi:hypothetical protein
MLDRFVAKRPTQKTDWFTTFPENLRSQTESEQVKQHLDEIMAIIKSFV